MDVDVTESTNSENKPIDLGTVAIEQVSKPLKAGDTAPDFEIADLDGKKVALLDFWATWCGPCIAEMPSVRSIYKDVAQDGRLAMLGVSLDEKAEPVKRFVAQHEIVWRQALAGKWGKSQVAAQYGVSFIPA